MPPPMATNAPKMPIAAYTREFAKRVVGFTRDEKNTALKLSSPRAPSVSAKRAATAPCTSKVSTAEMPPTISST